jgi:NAD+ synthase
MLERRIKMASMDADVVSKEIGDFVVDTVLRVGSTGSILGLSGGVDSTVTAGLIKKAFDERAGGLELVGYILPSGTNTSADTSDGEMVARKLGIRSETHSIQRIVDAYGSTNPEALADRFHKGNMQSRIRANVLSTKSATERKVLAGTGNKDEDFGIGFYTLFGDGAVHMSPISGLPKRLVREMAVYLGFSEIASREPSPGLEPGQTDFGDLGYSYDFVEVVTGAFEQGFSPGELYTHSQVVEVARRDSGLYEARFGTPKFLTTEEMVLDVAGRHERAKNKFEIISPPSPDITLEYT